MRLFDNMKRDYTGPALHSESKFYYMNRSARSEVNNIRIKLEDWFTHYPLKVRLEFRQRFRSNNNAQYYSSFFELFLHELLLKLNCRVSVHPNLSGATTKRPDFLITPPNGKKFYMEAVVVTNESDKEVAARNRENVVYDALNRLKSPNFFIGLNISGSPNTSPSAKRMRKFIKDRLDLLDPDQIIKDYEKNGTKNLPKWNFEHDGWKVEFYPIPKKPEKRGKPDTRPLGLFSGDIHMIETRTAIRDAIIAKANSYGKLNLPYIIAVNALGEHVEDIDIMEALFGREQCVFKWGKPVHGKPKMQRVPDGAWTSKSGSRYSRVSAALIAVKLLPWNIPDAFIRLCHNPWASNKYISELTRLHQFVPIDNKIKLITGESLGTILNISSGWPADN